MLRGPAECASPRWHNVSRRIDAAALTHRPREHIIVACEAVVFERNGTKRPLQQLPGLDLVEQFEKQDAEEDFAR